jgi:hypothetical protein
MWRLRTVYLFATDVDGTMVEAASFIVLSLGSFAGPSRRLDSHPAEDHRHAEAQAGAGELTDIDLAIHGEVWALHHPAQSDETNDHNGEIKTAINGRLRSAILVPLWRVLAPRWRRVAYTESDLRS